MKKIVKEKHREKAKFLGVLKVWQQRLATYVAMVNFAMIFYLYILESPMGLEWYHWSIIMVVGIVGIIFVDIKFIYPNSLHYAFKKNPGWIALKEQVEDNSRKLDEIIKKLEEK